MRRLLVLAVVAALAVGARAGLAAAATPTEQLRTEIERVIKVVQDPALKHRPDERRAAVRRIANGIFDFAETAKRSLGPHWQTRTPAEREEFVRLFADLLERSYIARIELYGGERIQYLGDSVDGNQANVRTKLVTNQGSEVPVDYRMLRRGDRWFVYDVNIEGVSLVSNYRNQSNRIIATSSYRELVRKMKAKQEGFDLQHGGPAKKL